jgi:hypothetical protein
LSITIFKKLSKKNNETKENKNERNLREAFTPSTKSSSGTSRFSFLSSFMPEEILGVPVNEIKKDISESTSQLTTL